MLLGLYVCVYFYSLTISHSVWIASLSASPSPHFLFIYTHSTQTPTQNIDNRQAKKPLTDDAVQQKIRDFAHVCAMADAVQGVIAVDGEDANLVQQVKREIGESKATATTSLHALPVTPWGHFVPALNALIGYAAGQSDDNRAGYILFVSAETSANRQSIQSLLHHMVHNPNTESETLVVGARLSGHDYKQQSVDDEARKDTEDAGKACTPQVVELNGRTTPWNTLALWNLRKLATTGFLLISDGHLTSAGTDPSYGVEEVITIALLQQLLGKERAVAKLVPVPGVSWDANFGADPDRQKWHESKMESKKSRAARQMEIMKLSGVVHHYQ